MKAIEIERLIHVCAAKNVARIKLKSENVEIELTFEMAYKDRLAGLNSPIATEMRLREQLPTKEEATHSRTIGEMLDFNRAQAERALRGVNPSSAMSDIELAMNPPRDLREAMEGDFDIRIPAPSAPGIKVEDKVNEVAPEDLTNG